MTWLLRKPFSRPRGSKATSMNKRWGPQISQHCTVMSQLSGTCWKNQGKISSLLHVFLTAFQGSTFLIVSLSLDHNVKGIYVVTFSTRWAAECIHRYVAAHYYKRKQALRASSLWRSQCKGLTLITHSKLDSMSNEDTFQSTASSPKHFSHHALDKIFVHKVRNWTLIRKHSLQYKWSTLCSLFTDATAYIKHAELYTCQR